MHHFSPSAASIAGWVYLVIFGSIIGYTAYVWLLANAPLGLIATYAYVNPVVAITLGVLFRGEQLTWRLLIGAAIVVIVGRDGRAAGADRDARARARERRRPRLTGDQASTVPT